MIVPETQIEEVPAKKQRKRNYVAHLAEFSFSPKFKWTAEEARAMFESAREPLVDQIYYEDCITGMQKLPGEVADLVVADPPFGLHFSGKEAMYNRKAEKVVGGYVDVAGGKDYAEFTRAWVAELPRVMKPRASAYIFSGWTNLKDILCAIGAAGLAVKNHIIWKYQFGVFTTTKFVSCHYHVLFVVKDARKYFFHRVQHYNEDVWAIKRTYQPGQEKNGTKLPEAVVQKCLDFSSKPGALVLDPFMGNGTTAVVARANFRHYLGFEKNEQMRRYINKNLLEVSAGQDFVPYQDRLPTLEDLRKQYPAAYEEFLKRQRASKVHG